MCLYPDVVLHAKKNITQRKNMKKQVLSILILALFPIAIFSQPFSTKTQWETYFKNRISALDPIEGIWSNTNTVKLYDSYNRLRDQSYNPQTETVAIYKSGNTYKVYSIDSDNIYMKRSFQNSATTGLYLFECYYPSSYSTAKANAVLTGNGLLEFSYEKPVSQLKKDFGSDYIAGMQVTFEHNWIKISPKAEDYSAKQKSSGTGFAISSEGFIVTNQHVVDRASKISVRGIKGDFSRVYNAKVIVEDKNNDLAIIKIDDQSFTSLGIPPYKVNSNLSDVGNSVYALGYPLRATMGDEVKLTNGIISSKTGFQGDITTYQVTVPVQPGNSGGPLFDSNGNIIGIINAKHIGAENASYAIKTSYLMNLLQVMNSTPNLPASNTISSKSLSEQVKFIKEFVYIIETE